jgi:hypothetical protein
MADLIRCEYHLAQHDYLQAEQNLDLLLLKLRNSGARYFLPYVLQLKSHALKETGRSEEAEVALKGALQAAEDIENRIDRWRILAELGETEAAEEIVRFISDNISDAELRETFLAHARIEIERSGRMASHSSPSVPAGEA